MATNTRQPGAHRIPVQCSCGKRLVALSEHAGKQVKCPACGHPVAVPSDSPTQTTPSVTSVGDEAEGISRITLIGMWSFAGVFALGCMVFLLWYNHSSNQARTTAANDRLSQAVVTAKEWIAGTSLLNGEAVEQQLSDALNNDDATETANGESVLSQVRIEQAQREAATVFSNAKQQIDGERIAEAVELLRKYLANPHATARADAQGLLAEAETAVSDKLTLDALTAMGDEELKGVEATGLIDDGKITHPRLLAARKETIQRNLGKAVERRESIRIAEERRREAERSAAMKRKRQTEAEEEIRRRENLTEIARRLRVESLYVRQAGDVELLVGVKESLAYIPKNYSFPFRKGTEIGFDIRFRKADNSVDEPSAGFIPINGKPEQVKFSSSDPDLIEVFDDGSAGVRGSGKAVVFVECAGTRISIPIQIFTTPFTVGYGESDSKDLINTLGIPQRKQAHFVRWPHSESIDQMYYGPDAGSFEVGEHWEYDKLPGLAIRVIGSFVKEIGMKDRPPNYPPKIIFP